MMRNIATCLVALGFVASCASTGVGLRSASDRLDESSDMFYRQLDRDRASRDTVDDAARLAEASHDFNREVSDGRGPDVLVPIFDRIAERYHELREEVDDRDNDYRYREAGFDRVTEAYLDVERAMDRQYGRRSSYRY